MKMRLRLYLDTSVVGAYMDDRLPERRQATLDFWARLGEYDVSVSELTVAELRATGQGNVRQQMAELIKPFGVLRIGEEARALAQEYLRRGVFSAATFADALHVAVAVTSRQDLLISWNFRHLVNRRRRALVNEANILRGYPRIEILAPPEV